MADSPPKSSSRSRRPTERLNGYDRKQGRLSNLSRSLGRLETPPTAEEQAAEQARQQAAIAKARGNASLPGQLKPLEYGEDEDEQDELDELDEEAEPPLLDNRLEDLENEVDRVEWLYQAIRKFGDRHNYREDPDFQDERSLLEVWNELRAKGSAAYSGAPTSEGVPRIQTGLTHVLKPETSGHSSRSRLVRTDDATIGLDGTRVLAHHRHEYGHSPLPKLARTDHTTLGLDGVVVSPPRAEALRQRVPSNPMKRPAADDAPPAKKRAIIPMSRIKILREENGKLAGGASTGGATNGISKLSQSTSKPSQPVSKPSQSTSKPSQSTSKPSQPASKPSQPASKPSQSASKPSQSGLKLSKPVPKPSKPTPNASQPAPRASQSAPKPSAPAPKPSQPAAKPSASAPQASKSAPQASKSAPQVSKPAPQVSRSAPQASTSAAKPVPRSPPDVEMQDPPRDNSEPRGASDQEDDDVEMEGPDEHGGAGGQGEEGEVGEEGEEGEDEEGEEGEEDAEEVPKEYGMLTKRQRSQLRRFPPEIRVLVQRVAEHVKVDSIVVCPFPEILTEDPKDKDNYLTRWMIKYWAEANDELREGQPALPFTQDHLNYIRKQFPISRNVVKQSSDGLVEIYFDLDRSDPDHATKARSLTDHGDERWISPNEANDDERFKHKIIGRTIVGTWFKNPRSFGYKHLESFTPLVPIPTIAYACCILRHQIKAFEFELGKASDLDSVIDSDSYKMYLDMLEDLRTESPGHLLAARVAITRMYLAAKPKPTVLPKPRMNIGEDRPIDMDSLEELKELLGAGAPDIDEWDGVKDVRKKKKKVKGKAPAKNAPSGSA